MPKGVMKNLTKVSNDKINIVSPCGFGDTMVLCGFKKALESRYDSPIHFIIKPKHEIIMKMYNMVDYSIQEFTEKELYDLASQNPMPKKGSLFVAHPMFLQQTELLTEFNNTKLHFLDLYKKSLCLSDNTRFEPSTTYPDLTEELKNKIERIAPVEKIVLIMPESNSLKVVSHKVFEQYVNEVVNEGYVAISSVVDKRNKIKGSTFIDLSVEEAIILSRYCKAVCATRSGICDLIAPIAKKITVFYPDTHSFYTYGLKVFTNEQSDISEVVTIGSIIEQIAPFLLVEQKHNESIYRLSLQIFKIKRTKNKLKLYFLGFPILYLNI